METEKMDDEWKLRKKILNASNRNKLCLKLAIWLFVMMSFVSTMTVLVFHGESHLYLFPLGKVLVFSSPRGSLLFIPIYDAIIFREEEKRLRTKFLNCISKLRSECQKSLSDEAAFQFDVYLKEIESILNAYNRKGFLDQDMESYQLDKYFVKIQSTIINSGDEFESIVNPREIREWRNVTAKYKKLMKNKPDTLIIRNMATIIHRYFCRKTGIAVN